MSGSTRPRRRVPAISIGLSRMHFTDIYFPNRPGRAFFIEPRGREIQDVSKETGLVNAAWSGDATFTDLNDDGFPDLYVLNMQGDDHFYENAGGKDSSTRTARYFPKLHGAPWVRSFRLQPRQPARSSSSSTCTRHDGASDRGGARHDAPRVRQKWCTTFWTDSFLQAAQQQHGNAFYLNGGDGKFEEGFGQGRRGNLLALGTKCRGSQCRWLRERLSQPAWAGPFATP